jgi:hypothetical protein
MLSQSVCKFFSLSVAFNDKPNDAVLPAQCGIFNVTGIKNSNPCGPHITKGDSICSPNLGGGGRTITKMEEKKREKYVINVS